MPAKPKPELYDPTKHPYPKMVYPGDPMPGTGKIVNSKEEEDDFRAKIAPVAEKKTEEKKDEPEKDGLLAQATMLGVAVDKRWGVERIKSEIAQAKKAD